MTTRFTHLRLVGPAAVLIAILLAGLAAIPYYGVARLDAEIRQRQETLVGRNISIWVSDVEFALTAWTIWDESIAKLDNIFDPEWTDRNIGRSLIGTSRTRFVAILNADDALIYSKTDEEVVERPFFVRGTDAAVEDARSLIDDVRKKERGERATGIPNPIAFSKIEVIGDDAVLLTASLFQPDFGTAKPRGARAPILISGIPIAGSLQEFLGDRFLLDDASVGPSGGIPDDRARVEIATGPSGQAQALSWRPLTPARDLLRQSLPLAVTVIVVLVAGGMLAVRTSRHAIASLVEAERRMRHAATHDFLTGLANRSLVASEFARLSQQGNLTVACLDLDGFKAINDGYGHGAGDEVLKAVAARLRSGCHERDVVFRLGGDEFAVLMPSVAFAEAENRCRQLCALLAQPYSVNATLMDVGASFGLSGVIEGEVSCDAALRRADEALYRAKVEGRGKIMTATSTIEPARRFG